MQNQGIGDLRLRSGFSNEQLRIQKEASKEKEEINKEISAMLEMRDMEVSPCDWGRVKKREELERDKEVRERVDQFYIWSEAKDGLIGELEDFNRGKHQFNRLEAKTPVELVQEYRSLCDKVFFLILGNICKIKAGEKKDGKIRRCYVSFYDRISKINILKKAEGKEGDVVLSMMLVAKFPFIDLPGKFPLFDSMGWFCANSEIEKKFNKIKFLFQTMDSLADSFCKNIENHDYDFKVSTFFGRMAVCIKEENLKIIQSTKTSEMNRRERLRAKADIYNRGENQINFIKEKAVNEIKYLKEIWSALMQDFYPNKFQAYLIFEIIFNRTDMVYNEHEDLGIFRDFILDYNMRSSRILLLVLDMLLPYAKEITQEFGIDLGQDQILSKLLNDKEKKILTSSMMEELKGYQSFASNGNEEVSKASKSQPVQQRNRRLANQQERAKKREAEAAARAREMQENSEKNKKIAEERKMAAQERKDALAVNRGEREANQKKLQERKAAKAKEIGDEHKSEVEAKEKQKAAERLEGKIHTLPEEQLVQAIIAGLTGEHKKCFEMLFHDSKVDNKYQIKPADVLNLAIHFRDLFKSNNVDCADDFLNMLKKHIHPNHGTGEGSLLPKNYVSILRGFFVIFGIFPEGWKPETTEDDYAWNVYLQRMVDLICSKNSL